MAKKTKKYSKSEYGPRKKPLPKALVFLDGFNFHAIVEDTSGANIKRLIEVKPVSLKRLIEEVKYLSDCLESETEAAEDLERETEKKEASYQLSIKNLKENISAVEAENSRLKNEMEQIVEEKSRLEYNNKILMGICDKYPDEQYIKSLKSHLNVMQDSEFTVTSSKPIQGGLVRGK